MSAITTLVWILYPQKRRPATGEAILALKNSDYSHELKFEQTNTRGKSKTSRTQNVIYFNPPWEDNVKTKVGEKNLKFVQIQFPTLQPIA